jgi:nardilysin
LLQENTWLPSQRLEAAELMNLGDVQLRARSSLRGTKLITYFHGDMNSQQASSIHNKISSTVGKYLDPNNHKDNESRGRFLPQQHTVVALPCFNPQDVNNALVMHIQTEVVSPKVSAIMLLIRRFMAEPLFSELRTQRQLGYIVSMSPDGHGRGLGSIRGVNFRVLSNRYSPLYLEQEVEDFLERQSIVFSKLTQQDISDLAATIIKSIIDPPTSYLEEAEQFRNSIINQVPFDWIEQIIKELENMKLEEFINKTNDWMFDKSKRKSVSILLFGNDNLGILKTFLESDCGNKKVVKSIEELNDLRDSLEMHNFDYKP